ncbi:response regulator [Salmonirosea aquatica]|uniref:Response regulator n=1 Tax=Salmonirosea aquatica TaxID=2654236 RepID=A0A7C9BBI7_9BACT|nr:response regulator [Cytophagaceae bacterium SJW1-29]
MRGTPIIYLVDDDPDDRFFLRQALLQTSQAMEVIEATSGFELMSMIQRAGSPLATLILMDMNMPKMSGVETVQAMRSNPGFPVIPVVMISTTNNPTFVQNAFDAGVAEFVSKPATVKGFADIANQLTIRYLG